MPAQIEQVVAATWVPEVTRTLLPVPDPWMSVIVPAYNEERGITQTVQALDGWLRERPGTHEIIVVDNASQDGTAAVLEGLNHIESLRVLTNSANLGKGHSLRRGMLEASGALRLHCDADCATSLPSLDAMVEAAQEVDVVVGSRLGPGATVLRKQPLRRRIVGRSFQQLCRLMLSEPTNDLYCGFKLWRAGAATQTFSRIRVEGWVFDAEALAMARSLGFSIREMGIHWADREGSRLSMARVLGPVVIELLGARRHVRRQTRGHDVHAAAEPETASRGL